MLVANAVETQPFHQRAAETEDNIGPAEMQSRKLFWIAIFPNLILFFK